MLIESDYCFSRISKYSIQIEKGTIHMIRLKSRNKSTYPSYLDHLNLPWSLESLAMYFL